MKILSKRRRRKSKEMQIYRFVNTTNQTYEHNKKLKKMGDTSIFFLFVMVAYLTYTRVGTGELV